MTKIYNMYDMHDMPNINTMDELDELDKMRELNDPYDKKTWYKNYEQMIYKIDKYTYLRVICECYDSIKEIGKSTCYYITHKITYGLTYGLTALGSFIKNEFEKTMNMSSEYI